MRHVVDALGGDKGPDLDRIALAMVDVATKVGSDDAVSFFFFFFFFLQGPEGIPLETRVSRRLGRLVSIPSREGGVLRTLESRGGDSISGITRL